MNLGALILTILVGILYIMWIIVILFFPIQFLNKCGIKCKQVKVSKLLKLPYSIFRYVTMGGIERFCIFTISSFPSRTLRKLYYRSIGASIGKRVIFI